MANNEELLPFCECGECGLRVTKSGNRFIKGHHQRGENNSFFGKKHSVESLEKISVAKRNPSKETLNKLRNAQIGKILSDKTKKKISDANKGENNPNFGKRYSEKDRIKNRDVQLREKDPLPDGWETKEGKMVTNKDCAQYLGCYISEQILSKIFKYVKVMPLGNHGYDLICNQNYKIDVKSSATGYKGGWHFNICKNGIPDYFLCIAFEDRGNLDPIHLWLIPGKDINHLTGIEISKSKNNLKKWAKYEQPLDKVILCCDEMRGE